ncbi:hypothetical protein CPB84DRAFT_1780713 [Gymnopilus junonius]|uniref:Uncharacterized protein n=1 Tax=Gymnopilus junonius TaxID=109634 RepID=A0A9P5TLH5_GYMJU|nr:hypothetical protein CPB84DRAFT_1780713 [Gymnopilus junonius]
MRRFLESFSPTSILPALVTTNSVFLIRIFMFWSRGFSAFFLVSSAFLHTSQLQFSSLPFVCSSILIVSGFLCSTKCIVI